MTLTDKRWPSCDRWHPNEPSEIVRHMRTSHLAREKYGHTCRLCNRLAYKYRKVHGKLGRETREKHTNDPYGVIPLNWRPPEWPAS